MAVFVRTTLGALGAVLTLLAPVSPAVASGADAAGEATVGRLVLQPSDRGYQGELPVTVTNHGDSSTARLLVTEPVAGSWRGTVSNEFCMVTTPKQYLRTFDCWLLVAPGESRTVTVRFEVLTRTRPYAMSAAGGQVAVQVGDDAPGAAPFETVFRSTTGSLRHPRPYLQDTRARAAISTGEAVLTRRADGSWAGWLPVTVRYRSDAPHNYLNVRSTLPAGTDIEATDPADLPAFGTGFVVPGGRFMEGERRTFRVLLTAPAGTQPGALGTGEFVLQTWYEGGDVAEATPRDNVASFSISAVDAG